MDRHSITRFVLQVCAFWGHLYQDLDIERKHKLLIHVGRAALIWSLVIVLTNNIKLFIYPKLSQGSSLQNLLTLNYLPNIDSYGTLYYKLMLSLVGGPFIWKFLLHFYQPLTGEALEILNFYFRPRPSEEIQRIREREEEEKWVAWLQKPSEAEEELGELASRTRGFKNGQLRCSKKKISYLTHLYQSQSPLVDEFNCNNSDASLYVNPIHAFEFLSFNACERWNYTMHKLGYIISVFSIIVGLVYYIFFNAVATITGRYGCSGSNCNWLAIYGILEQFYACSQVVMITIITNVFIMIFYYDLKFKSRFIESDLDELIPLMEAHKNENQLQPFEPRLMRKIYKSQMQILSFFDTINQIDKFASKFCAITLMRLITAFTFAFFFFRTNDFYVRAGTATLLLFNVIGFSILSYASWEIEEMTTVLYQKIALMAEFDHDIALKLGWLEIFKCFRKGYARTFTFLNINTLNFSFYFKILYTLIFLVYITNKLFERLESDDSFSKFN